MFQSFFLSTKSYLLFDFIKKILSLFDFKKRFITLGLDKKNINNVKKRKMSIQFYLRKVHLQIYLWKKKRSLTNFL